MDIKKIHGLDLNSMREHILSEFSDYVDFENNTESSCGVYFIEDFYIGKSNNLKSRIVSHLIDATTTQTNRTLGKSLNYEKILKLKQILSYKKLSVVLLDTDVHNENIYIDGYYLCNPLTNKVGMNSDKKFLKVKNILEYVNNSKITSEKVMASMWISSIRVDYPIKIEIMVRAKTESESIQRLKNYIGLN